MIVQYQEHTPAPLLITRGPTTGEIYLHGFSDGYYARPRVIQRTRKAQAAYTKGYQAGQAQKQKERQPPQL